MTPQDAAALVAAPIERDLAKRLLGFDAQKKGLGTFGCRHCEQFRDSRAEEEAPQADRTSEKASESGEQKRRGPKFTRKQPKEFEFNGLRSHLKEK